MEAAGTGARRFNGLCGAWHPGAWCFDCSLQCKCLDRVHEALTYFRQRRISLRLSLRLEGSPLRNRGNDALSIGFRVG